MNNKSLCGYLGAGWYDKKVCLYTWDRLTWVQTPEKGICQIVNCVVARHLALGIKICNDYCFPVDREVVKSKKKTQFREPQLVKYCVFHSQC